MTTLADINQTLMVQNEMQEKTTKAVDSLTKRFAAFLRVVKGDKLEDLEQRREARRENRAMGFARAAGNVAESVKRQTPLLLKILGGAAVAAYILQNKELREAIGGLLSESVKLINETVFQDPEFQRGLKEVGRIVGEAISAAFVAVLPSWLKPDRFDPNVDQDGDGDVDIQDRAAAKNAELGLYLGGGAIASTLLMAADVVRPKKWVKGFTNGPRQTGGGLDAARQLKADQELEARRVAQRAAAANSAQQRFTANQAARLSTSQKLTQMTSSTTLGQRVSNLARGVGRSVNAAAAPIARGVGRSVNAAAPIARGVGRSVNAAAPIARGVGRSVNAASQKLTQMTSSTTLGQRVSNLARGVGRSVNAASRTVRGGPGMTAATVAGSLFNAPMLSDGTITKIEPETGAEIRVTGYGSEFANIGEAAVAASEAGKILSLAERDFLRTRDEGLLKYQRLLSQLTLDFEQASYINRLLEARARLLTEENLPRSTGDPILDAAKLFGPSLAENTVSVDEFMGRVIPLTELPAPGIQRDVQARFEGMRQNMIEPLVQSKVPALEQAMDGAGTGAPIVVPVPIPMDAGKGPGPVVSQGTVGGSLSAGETIHLNQDPATIIGGVPRQQSGGGGGW